MRISAVCGRGSWGIFIRTCLSRRAAARVEYELYDTAANLAHRTEHNHDDEHDNDALCSRIEHPNPVDGDHKGIIFVGCHGEGGGSGWWRDGVRLCLWCGWGWFFCHEFSISIRALIENSTDFVGIFCVHELVAQIARAVEVADVYFEKAFERLERPSHLRLVVIKLVEMITQ